MTDTLKMISILESGKSLTRSQELILEVLRELAAKPPSKKKTIHKKAIGIKPHSDMRDRYPDHDLSKETLTRRVKPTPSLLPGKAR